jgi:DNA-directed RNA polymerase subunit N (RpoN/RPB10)
MIIPIKCFTCGNVLADKYRYYQEQVLQMKMDKAKTASEDEKQQIFSIKYLTKDNAAKTPEAIMLDKLGLKNICCRRHMLCHVDIE